MTCKDCVHYEVCRDWYKQRRNCLDADDCIGRDCDKNCSFFKDKNLFVKVVRCKDCKHYKKSAREWNCFHPKQECGWNSEGGECLEMKPDDYCSYGELKECEGK